MRNFIGSPHRRHDGTLSALAGGKLPGPHRVPFNCTLMTQATEHVAGE
jgi:hypothetical protein